MGMITVRFALVSDAPALGKIQVEAWRATYRGFFTDTYLDALDPETKAAEWAEAIAKNDPRFPRWVAEREGRILGYVTAGEVTLPVPGYPHELKSIYTDPGAKGRGAGRALMAAYQAWLSEKSDPAYHLWVGKQNHAAHAFYERLGGARVAERTDRIFGGVVTPEWAYGWRLR